MRNKILIVSAQAEDREQLEQILQEIVDEGGELFLTEKREDGLAIFNKEQPLLIFLDSALVGKEGDWMHREAHIILLGSKKELQQKSEDFLIKPFKHQQ